MSDTRTPVATESREDPPHGDGVANSAFPNRREFTRVLVPIKAVTTSDSKQTVRGHCRDVSMKGTHIHCEQPFEIGTPCDCVLCWDTAESQLSIPVRAKVVRVDPSGMSLEFTEMGMGSYQHLQRLVLFNAADPDQLDAELISHVGLKTRS